MSNPPMCPPRKRVPDRLNGITAMTPEDRKRVERIALDVLNRSRTPRTALSVALAAEKRGHAITYADALGALERLANRRVIIGTQAPVASRATAYAVRRKDEPS